MSPYVTVEELQGIGNVWTNGTVAFPSVRYQITVSQHMIETQTLQDRGEIPGLASIEGSVESPSPIAFVSLVGEPIELELEDGRRWKCFMRSSNGDLSNRGGIE